MRCASLTHDAAQRQHRHLADHPALGRVDRRDLDGRLGGVEGDDLLLGRGHDRQVAQPLGGGGTLGPQRGERAGQVAGGAVHGVVRGDQAAAQVVGGLGADRQVAVDRHGRAQPGGGGQRVGPVEPHPAPLGVLHGRPAGGVRGERAELLPRGLGLGPAEGLGHRARGGEDDGGGGDHRVVAGQHRAQAGVTGEHAAPQRGVGHPGGRGVRGVAVQRAGDLLGQLLRRGCGDLRGRAGHAGPVLHPGVEVVGIRLERRRQGRCGGDPQGGLPRAAGGRGLGVVTEHDQADARQHGHEHHHREHHERPAAAPARCGRVPVARGGTTASPSRIGRPCCSRHGPSVSDRTPAGTTK